MNKEKQCIAIAEACGWTREYADVPTWVASLDSYKGSISYSVSTLLFRRSEKCVIARHLPDYLNDLNAMHGAEKVLTADQWYQYDKLMPLRDPQKMHATATQRAEAFLRTIGKWVE